MRKDLIIKGLLFVSISLNVIFVASATGRTLFMQSERKADVVKTISTRLKALPKTERDEVKKIFRQNRKKLRDVREEIKKSRRNIAHFMGSSVYTRDEAERLLTDLRNKTSDMHRITQDRMLDVADSLPPEKRVELFKGRNNRHGKRVRRDNRHP